MCAFSTVSCVAQDAAAVIAQVNDAFHVRIKLSSLVNVHASVIRPPRRQVTMREFPVVKAETDWVALQQTRFTRAQSTSKLVWRHMVEILGAWEHRSCRLVDLTDVSSSQVAARVASNNLTGGQGYVIIHALETDYKETEKKYLVVVRMIELDGLHGHVFGRSDSGQKSHGFVLMGNCSLIWLWRVQDSSDRKVQ